MPKKLDYQLSNDELQTIELAISQSKSVRVVKRANRIRLLHLGHEPAEVAQMLLVNVASIYNWHKRFRAEGISGLEDHPRSGRPRIADDTYCRALEEALEKQPAEYGYDFAIWTVDRLREHLEQQTGKSLSRERFRAALVGDRSSPPGGGGLWATRQSAGLRRL